MSIKYLSSLVDGSVNLFKEISLVKKFMKSKSYLDTILGSLQTNSYFAHPHNFLIAMLGDFYNMMKRMSLRIYIEVNQLVTHLRRNDAWLQRVTAETILREDT